MSMAMYDGNMENHESKFIHIAPPKQIVWAVVVFLAVASLLLLVMLRNEARGYNRTQPPTTINVSGEGKEFIKPDVATVNVGVVKQNVDLLKAQRDAADAINRVTAVLKDKGVAEKDIKTISFNIYPQYDYQDGVQKFRGYEVRQTLEVKMRNLENVGGIIAGVAASGANEVGSLSFTVDDPKAIQEQARQAAIAEAKVKAQKLASDLGVSLVRLVNYSESGGGNPPPIFYAKSEGLGGGVMAPAPSIPTGENEIDINVNLSYEIK